MKIKYTGCAKDYSGYGEAVRHDIAALHQAGVEVSTEIPMYVHEIADFGFLGRLATSLENRHQQWELSDTYRIKILHTTPNVYPKYFSSHERHPAS
jgi:hypothetical protein